MQKGHKHSKKTKEKMKQSALVRNNSKRVASLPKGGEHWNWKEKPSILALHKRLHRKYGSAKKYLCVKKCGRTAIDWALKPRREHTGIRKDYDPLCRKCHIAQDDHPSKVDRSKHIIIRDNKGRIKATILK